MTLKPILLLAAVLLLILPPTLGIKAYDCRQPTKPFRRIDLTSTAECTDPETDYLKPTKMKAQVIQIAKKYPVKATTCKIIYTHTVTRCGFDSINYGSETPVYEAVYPLTRKECIQAVKNQKIKLWNKELVVNTKADTAAGFYTKGQRYASGKCKTETFSTNGKVYYGSYQYTTVRMSFKTIRGFKAENLLPLHFSD